MPPVVQKFMMRPPRALDEVTEVSGVSSVGGMTEELQDQPGRRQRGRPRVEVDGQAAERKDGVREEYVQVMPVKAADVGYLGGAIQMTQRDGQAGPHIQSSRSPAADNRKDGMQEPQRRLERQEGNTSTMDMNSRATHDGVSEQLVSRSGETATKQSSAKKSVTP
jgi:hypothetical protein